MTPQNLLSLVITALIVVALVMLVMNLAGG